MSLASIQIRNSILRNCQSSRMAVRCFNSNQFSTKSQSCIPSTSTSTLTSSSHISRSRNLSTSAVSRNAHSAPQDEGEKKIYNLLNESFNPKELKVQDVSGGCGSFYAITLSSKSFAGVPTVKAHRMVNETLKEVIPGIHGLQLKTIAEE